MESSRSTIKINRTQERKDGELNFTMDESEGCFRSLTILAHQNVNLLRTLVKLRLKYILIFYKRKNNY